MTDVARVARPGLIQIFLTEEHSYTVAPPWQPDHQLSDLIRPFPYEEAIRRHHLPSGCYVFSDLDRLTPSAYKAVVRLHGGLVTDPHTTVVNDPVRSLTRLDLLQLLEKEGINPFRARPLKRWKELRFPIFLREKDAHRGPLTDLLHSENAVNRSIRRMRLRGMTGRHLLAVEYCDTSDADGRFRKYGAFRIGDRIVPRHVFFGWHWMTKQSDLRDEDAAREELRFVETNPHEESLRSIFDMAHIRYGRIDYSFHQGRLVVWEINPNPLLIPQARRSRDDRVLRAQARKIGIELLRDAMEELDRATEPQQPGHVLLDRSRSLILRASVAGLRERARRKWFVTASRFLAADA